MPHTGAALRTTMDVNFAPTVGASAASAAAANTDLRTNVLLADFSWERTDARLKGPGGALEARTVNRPSEILVRTPRGELFIQTQLGDWSLRDELKQVVAAQSAGGAAGGAPAPPAPGSASICACAAATMRK